MLRELQQDLVESQQVAPYRGGIETPRAHRPNRPAATRL
jgi:hypothetical protein